MSWVDAMRHRAAVWLRPNAYDAEMGEEMRHHLDLDAAQHAASAADARPARRFGNRTSYLEQRRETAGLHVLEDIRLDARHLVRSLRHARGFAIIAVLTLAIGIGVTTGIVSITDHVLLRSLPFRDAGRLMMMLERDDHGGFRTPSAPTAADWQRDAGAAQAFEGITYIRGDGVTLRVGEETETVGAGFVAPEFFPLLGARPRLGRVLADDDHRAGVPVAVMSHRLWQRRFAGDPAIVGRTISVDSIPTAVIGVLPLGAVYPGFADLWQPISQYRHPDILRRRGFHADSRTLARLRAGVDSTRAVSLMRGVGARLAQEYPAEQAHWMPAMIPVRQEIIGGVGPMLWMLSAAAAAVLLLACTNVASLLLARVATRTRELAVRSALGASRRRMVRQLLTESLVLAGVGGAFGAALAFAAVTASRGVVANQLPRMDELRMDWRVLLLAGVVTMLTAVACGVWPALRATRLKGLEALRASAMGSVGIRSESRLRRLLVAVQFALALVLLVGAGLLLQSFRRVASETIGFDPRGVLTFRVREGPSREPADAAALYQRLLESVGQVPGVTDAAFINHVPYGGAAITTTLTIDGRSTLDSSNQIFYRTVSGSYLRTMQMTMASGRWFDDQDIRSPGGSIIVNQAMASRYWPGTNPVGQRITVTRASQARKDFGEPLPATVIGVVADVHQTAQDIAPQPEVYVPYTLETWPWGSLVVRARDGARAIPALVRAVRAVDSRLVAEGATGAREFRALEEAVADSLQPRLLAIKLIGAFAACALMLATIGMYGVVAYSIAQRTREIGVRKALGASNGSIVALIFRESGAVLLAGAIVGAAASWAGARLIRGLLFNTAPTDPLAYVAALAVLASVALLASYVPARRAMALDPVIALRGD